MGLPRLRLMQFPLRALFAPTAGPPLTRHQHAAPTGQMSTPIGTPARSVVTRIEGPLLDTAAEGCPSPAPAPAVGGVAGSAGQAPPVSLDPDTRRVYDACQQLLDGLDVLLYRPREGLYLYSNGSCGEGAGAGVFTGRGDYTVVPVAFSLSQFDSLFEEAQHKVAMYAPFWVPIVYPLFIGLYTLLKA